MAQGRPKIANYDPQKEYRALYNIYSISFYNIMGPDKLKEIGRQLVRLKRLENRAQEIIEEYNLIRTAKLSLSRRALESYSVLRWRLNQDKKRSYFNLDDERLKPYLESLVQEDRDNILSFGQELKILNANLKIEWVRYLEMCEVAELSIDKIVMPKNFQALL